ncbi:Conserved_hypothetical protein [Hexamita inflata]|uniref:Uncharacterized protein n=1 Tax=Hexamita inflata TaxID=28002 RepID=A0AA86Q237_9EUKA|nr:Conserved hypothetical protein [Hexamita inflata]
MQNSYFSTQILDDYKYVYQLKKIVDDQIIDIMFDEIISDDTIVVMPIIVLDIYYRLNDIHIFAPLTNNLKSLINNQEVAEIMVSSINVDNAASQYRLLFDNQYDQYLANNYEGKPPEVQQLILERIYLYKYSMEVYQLHQFSFSTGDNWEQIMREQLKAQPTALTEKFRVGQIDGKLSVTKALTVQSKMIDNQTTVSGFLTVVLNQPYKFPIDEPYTLFDSNMRYIAGVNDQRYHSGAKQILFINRYIKNIFVNYTMGNILNVLELNNNFWFDAFQRSSNKEFTIVITQNKSTFQNRIPENDYNQSEVHQRSVIFSANCDYYLSGQIIVKQLGAIDGLLVLYKDVVLTNYSKEFTVSASHTIGDVSNYYGNLNRRSQSTIYTSKYQLNYQNIITLRLNKRENTLILYLMCVPVILSIIILIRKFLVANPSFDYYYQEELKQQIFSTSIQSIKYYLRRIINQINLLHIVDQEIFYYINYIESLSRREVSQTIPGLIFSNDLQKYQLLQHGATHEHIYEYLLKLTETKEQPNIFSFQILVTSQQYSIIMNGILQSKSWISSKFAKFTGSLQVRYKACTNVSVLKVRNSRYTSRIQSRVMSSGDLFQALQEPNEKPNDLDQEVYVSKVFDDSNLFMDRKLSSPCKVSIFKFKSSTVKFNTQLTDLLEQSKTK